MFLAHRTHDRSDDEAKTGHQKTEADNLVRAIKRATRRKFSAEGKIRMVLAGLRGEDSIAELCRE